MSHRTVIIISKSRRDCLKLMPEKTRFFHCALHSNYAISLLLCDSHKKSSLICIPISSIVSEWGGEWAPFAIIYYYNIFVADQNIQWSCDCIEIDCIRLNHVHLSTISRAHAHTQRYGEPSDESKCCAFRLERQTKFTNTDRYTLTIDRFGPVCESIHFLDVRSRGVQCSTDRQTGEITFAQCNRRSC